MVVTSATYFSRKDKQDCRGWRRLSPLAIFNFRCVSNRHQEYTREA